MKVALGRRLLPFRAAGSLLNHAAKAIELEDIEAQVAELERSRAETADQSP